MSFHATSGRIWIEDGTSVVFDTNEKGFNGTDYVTGSISFPAQVASASSSGGGTSINVDTSHTLATINSSADTTIGSIKITASSPQGIANLGWFTVQGTYLHFISGVGYFTAPTEFWAPEDVALYTFIASGGTLSLKERVALPVMPPASGTAYLTLNAFTMDYKIYCGTFT